VFDEPKRFTDNWLQASDAIDYDDLAALVDALDCFKEDVQQKLSLRTATRAEKAPDRRPVGLGGANQGVRRSSRRIASAPRLASPGSLFITEHETTPEFSDEDRETPPAALHEASSGNQAITIATSRTPFGDPTLSNETPIENVHRIEAVQRTRNLEQEKPYSVLYQTRAATNEHDDHTYVQPVRVFSGDPAAPHQFPCDNLQSDVDTLHQTDDMGYREFQSGANSPHRALFSPPFPDSAEPHVSISPTCDIEIGNSDGEDITMHNAPSPQFFNEAFEGLYDSPLQHEPHISTEDSMAACDAQHSVDQDFTQSFVDDPVFQHYLHLACRSSFRLPHETLEDTDDAEARELLSPLVEGKPLTTRLLHGLIYSLIPGPLRILEVHSTAGCEALSPDEDLAENFAIILHESGEGLPLLLLGDVKRRMLFVVSSNTPDPSLLATLFPTLPEWENKNIDV